MKKIQFLFILLIGFLNLINTVNANTDSTNAFNFTYNCINWQWILETDFNLWGHHHYLRQYKINKPWIIEISDWNHSTVKKSTNISISWCDYVPTNCTITNEWEWKYISWQDINNRIISITTNSLLTQSGTTINIEWSWSTNEVSIDVIWSWTTENVYSWSWYKLSLELLNDKIILKKTWYGMMGNLNTEEDEILNFINREIAWKKEYYYEISEDFKTIKLQKRLFEKESTGLTYSSENNSDIFSSYNWTNTWANGCSSPKWKTNTGYCTGLDSWDYNQHKYTTTKVKLYRVEISCTEIKYSNGTDHIFSNGYNSTLWGIIKPVFELPENINWVELWNWGYTLYWTSKINIYWLNYKTVWKIWTKSLWVKNIKITLKENDITLWEVNKVLSNVKKTIWKFEWLDNLEIKNSTWAILTETAWNYQIVFTFFDDKWQSLWTAETSLTIIPNNNFISSDLSFINTPVFATNNTIDKLKICQEITDEFWNKINKEYEVSAPIIIDGIINNWNEVLKISNSSFEDSKFCFDINSLAPAFKTLKFILKIPKHKQNINLDSNLLYKSFTKITPYKIKFKNPISITLESEDKAQMWKLNIYNIILNNIWNINIDWDLNFNRSNIINLVSWHYWVKFNIIKKKFSNLSNLSFSWLLDATNNALKSPKIQVQWASISYVLWWNTIKYVLDDSNELIWWVSCNRKSLWVKIYWIIQWEWKTELTWQKANISYLYKWNLRAKIRKNAFKLISNRESDKTKNIDGIIYVIWNTKYSEIKNYLNSNDTIIVKDWNFIIDEDINKFIWIIVLKNNYRITTDYNKSWNIYINNNVGNINAVVYADWALRSSKENWKIYSDTELEKQLKLNWSLFTRNTIGWAIKWNTNFVLPWWKLINDYDLASIYDLNYLRKVSVKCDLSKNDGISFIIEYNPSIQTNPPKGFSE